MAATEVQHEIDQFFANSCGGEPVPVVEAAPSGVPDFVPVSELDLPDGAEPKFRHVVLYDTRTGESHDFTQVLYKTGGYTCKLTLPFNTDNNPFV